MMKWLRGVLTSMTAGRTPATAPADGVTVSVLLEDHVYALEVLPRLRRAGLRTTRVAPYVVEGETDESLVPALEAVDGVEAVVLMRRELPGIVLEGTPVTERELAGMLRDGNRPIVR